MKILKKYQKSETVRSLIYQCIKEITFNLSNNYQILIIILSTYLSVNFRLINNKIFDRSVKSRILMKFANKFIGRKSPLICRLNRGLFTIFKSFLRVKYHVNALSDRPSGPDINPISRRHDQLPTTFPSRHAQYARFNNLPAIPPSYTRALYRYLHMHSYVHKNAKILFSLLFSDLRDKPLPPLSILDAHIFRMGILWEL